jgi:hypothetical protein
MGVLRPGAEEGAEGTPVALTVVAGGRSSSLREVRRRVRRTGTAHVIGRPTAAALAHRTPQVDGSSPQNTDHDGHEPGTVPSPS